MLKCEKGTVALDDAYTHHKAKELCEIIRAGEYPWITESLYALEKCNIKDGNTSLHLAIDIENKQIFTYILAMLKVRDHIR
jgi:hypothetical protein